MTTANLLGHVKMCVVASIELLVHSSSSLQYWNWTTMFLFCHEMIRIDQLTQTKSFHFHGDGQCFFMKAHYVNVNNSKAYLRVTKIPINIYIYMLIKHIYHIFTRIISVFLRIRLVSTGNPLPSHHNAGADEQSGSQQDGADATSDQWRVEQESVDSS